MIGLDTNVLVRYLAQDDAKQAAIAESTDRTGRDLGGMTSPVARVPLPNCGSAER